MKSIFLAGILAILGFIFVETQPEVDTTSVVETVVCQGCDTIPFISQRVDCLPQSAATAELNIWGISGFCDPHGSICVEELGCWFDIFIRGWQLPPDAEVKIFTTLNGDPSTTTEIVSTTCRS